MQSPLGSWRLADRSSQINILTNSSAASTNHTFLAYRGTEAAQPAPLIYDSTGELIWSGAEYGNSMDLIVQEYLGEPVLTFFDGSFFSGELEVHDSRSSF
mgnify:CR=1 FL=1